MIKVSLNPDSKFKYQILTLAVAPLLIMFSLIIGLIYYQSGKLTAEEAQLIRRETLASKKQELLKYLELARKTIEPIYDSASADDEDAKKQVVSILNNLTFGDDGYFFAYTYDGTNLVLPYQSELLGKNLWDVEDYRGFKLLQALIKQAQDGGGFVTYYWHKPSRQEPVEKLSYAIGLDKWGWMVGTGVYLDDVEKQTASINNKIEATISKTFLGLAMTLVVSLGVLASFATSIHLGERQLANSKLQQLNRRIIESQEEERNRVARELHDGINQILVSAKFRLDSIEEAGDEQERAGHIEKGRQAIALAVGELRRISRDLRPTILDDLGLLVALESLAKEVSERSGVEVLFEHHIGSKLLSPEQELTLYRVAQEALHNAEKYSGAGAIDMILQQEGCDVMLTIADDGAGMRENRTAPAEGDASMGLRNMRERVEYLNGRFAVNSSQEEGTEIRVVLPVLPTAAV